MPVTVQDFIKAIRIIVNRHDGNEYASLDEVLTSEMFDALLSRARQEAVEKFLLDMKKSTMRPFSGKGYSQVFSGGVMEKFEVYTNNETGNIVVNTESGAFELVNDDLKKKILEARREALKEMDEAWKRVLSNDQPESALMRKLRQEYSNQQ